MTRKIRMFIDESGDTEVFYPLEYFKDYLKDNKFESIILQEAVKEIPAGPWMWCKYYGDYIARGDNDCGRTCSGYIPRNGKRGMCKELTNLYQTNGQYYRLTENGLERIENNLIKKEG